MLRHECPITWAKKDAERRLCPRPMKNSNSILANGSFHEIRQFLGPPPQPLLENGAGNLQGLQTIHPPAVRIVINDVLPDEVMRWNVESHSHAQSLLVGR